MSIRNPFQRADGGSFLPQDYVARKSEMRANLLCLALFGIVLFGVVAAFFVTNRQRLQVEREQQAITVRYSKEAAKIDQLKQLERQRAEMLEKAEITTALIEKVPRSRLIAELVNRMPTDITLLEMNLISKRLKDAAATAAAAAATPKGGGSGDKSIKTLTPTSDKPVATAKKSLKDALPSEKPQAPRFEYTLKLTGVAKVNNSIADYIAGLKSCSFLANVDLKFIKEATIDKVELRKFEIEATIRKDADARDLTTPNELREAAGVPGTDPTRSSPEVSAQPGPKPEEK